MACEELNACLSENARPRGALTDVARPRTDGFCRDYNFAQSDDIVTIGDFIPILSLAGNQLETIA